jgi:uncharacterized protein YegP (UPF0339 family)
MQTRPYPSYWIYRDNCGEWRWRYDASNGRTIAVSSESYVRKADCERGIEIMKASFNSETWIPTVDSAAA